ncbi:hypothetical protein E2C01_071442 [Portunus trituberculatus]|uniref:Uncharacterized protein n=1 Tax=Portunus trituberculatus TaxID=210409 RepID=A0A5B7I4G6_PORTR|nr:hypothetical protein [Portunus trituberculatus]
MLEEFLILVTFWTEDLSTITKLPGSNNAAAAPTITNKLQAQAQGSATQQHFWRLCFSPQQHFWRLCFPNSIIMVILRGRDPRAPAQPSTSTQTQPTQPQPPTQTSTPAQTYTPTQPTGT